MYMEKSKKIPKGNPWDESLSTQHRQMQEHLGIIKHPDKFFTSISHHVITGTRFFSYMKPLCFQKLLHGHVFHEN